MSRINLLDSADTISMKIKKCKTDAFIGLEFGNVLRPECENLLGLYQSTSGKNKEEIALEVANMKWGTFKVRRLSPYHLVT